MATLGKFELPNRLIKEEETATDKYAKFIADPFESGYGHTIGNAFRRVLLSSIEGAAISSIKIDGGMSNNSFFSQLLADTLKTEIYRPKDIETTALGATYLAAIGSGFATKEDLKDFWKIDKKF